MVNVSSGPGGRSGAMRIFDLIDPAKFTPLLLDAASPADTPLNDRAEAVVSSALPQSLNVWHIMNTNAPALTEHYGKDRPCLYLIRPGGYVMQRGTPADADKAAHFCRRLFYCSPV